MQHIENKKNFKNYISFALIIMFLGAMFLQQSVMESGESQRSIRSSITLEQITFNAKQANQLNIIEPAADNANTQKSTNELLNKSQ